jgi:hypothetical protein
MSYTLISRDVRKAAKPHKCIWCGESIAVGTIYVHERSIFEREAQSHNWHQECEDAMHEAAGGEPACEMSFDPYQNERPARETEGGK